MKINNPDLGFKPWGKTSRRQKFTQVSNPETRFTLFYPRQFETPQGRRRDENVLQYVAK